MLSWLVIEFIEKSEVSWVKITFGELKVLNESKLICDSWSVNFFSLFKCALIIELKLHEFWLSFSFLTFITDYSRFWDTTLWISENSQLELFKSIYSEIYELFLFLMSINWFESYT